VILQRQEGRKDYDRINSLMMKLEKAGSLG
jgi:hypothetical protein